MATKPPTSRYHIAITIHPFPIPFPASSSEPFVGICWINSSKVAAATSTRSMRSMGLAGPSASRDGEITPGFHHGDFHRKVSVT